MKGSDIVDKRRILANKARKNIIMMLNEAGSGHPGGSLSCIDIIVSLYEHMNVDPSNPRMDNRDRFILSKGHAAPALYAVLAQKGFFPEEEIYSLRRLNSILQGHPDMNKTPGVDASTGSLGQGFSVAVGMALGAKYKKSNYNVYALLGDGELQEGIVWEAAMTASHYKLGNLVAIVDCNGLQLDGPVNDIMALGNLRQRFESFGFKVIEVDGHDFEEIDKAIKSITGNMPTCILAKSIKGKGVSFMENQVGWHGSAISDVQAQQAIKELEEAL